MDSTLLNMLPEMLELAFFAAGSLLLSVGGALLERSALLSVQGGESVLGGWVALIGVLAFYFAYLMFTDKFIPKLTTLR
jgi:hypothetical protein